MLTYGLSQIVDQPTRGNNILDVVLCSDVLCCDDVDVLPPISTSDHNVVCFNLSLCFAQQQQTANEMSSRHNFSKADWEGICGFLSAVDWNLLFSSVTTADELWNAFIDTVQQAIDLFVPLFPHSRHSSATTFYPKHIRKLLAEKKARWKIFNKFRTPELKIKYKKVANKCRKEIINFTAQKENKLCENANLGSFYKYINRKLNGSNGIAPLKNTSGEVVSDNFSKAELLNDYFSNVFVHDNGIIDEKWRISKCGSTMNPVSVTPSMIRKSINKIKKTGGAGPDNLPSEFFKKYQQFITYPLSIIYLLVSNFGAISCKFLYRLE